LKAIISNALRDHRAVPIDNRRQGATWSTAGTASAAVEALRSVTLAKHRIANFRGWFMAQAWQQSIFRGFSESCAGFMNGALCCWKNFSEARDDMVK
jgi:hypothetical protein